jgi:hypothetical protein
VQVALIFRKAEAEAEAEAEAAWRKQECGDRIFWNRFN